MKEENNKANKNINKLQSGSNKIYARKEELLETLLQEGEVVIQSYKISLKNYKNHKSLTMEGFKENLRNSINFYNEVGREHSFEDLPEEAMVLVEEYKNERFELYKLKIFAKDESGGYERLLKNILQINFSSLKYLNLANCNLQRFESISFINAPLLKLLDLSKNNFSNVNALIKFHFPQLTYLSIYNNYIQNTEKLSRFNSNRLKTFYFELFFPENNNQEQIIQDVRFLLKLNYELEPKVILLMNPNRNTQLIRRILLKLNGKGNEIMLNKEKFIF